jgi:hypothetical protein
MGEEKVRSEREFGVRSPGFSRWGIEILGDVSKVFAAPAEAGTPNSAIIATASRTQICSFPGKWANFSVR